MDVIQFQKPEGTVMNLVTLHGVSKIYGSTVALDDFNLRIESQERIVILGPSGCGKTTILRLLAGFMAPDNGRISMNGQVVAENKTILIPPEQRNIGMVFQDLALWPHLSVEGNLAFGLKAQGIHRKKRAVKIKEMLQLVGLEGFGQRKPSELSGGQQQRVALARALVSEPRLLLMDEPLSSLDQDLNERLRAEILRLQKKLGFTLLYVTHDRDEAFAMATRIIIMNKGCVEFDGDPVDAKKYLK